KDSNRAPLLSASNCRRQNKAPAIAGSPLQAQYESLLIHLSYWPKARLDRIRHSARLGDGKQQTVSGNHLCYVNSRSIQVLETARQLRTTTTTLAEIML